MFLEIISSTIAAAVIYLLIDYVTQLAELNKYPSGPIPLPLIGNLHLLGKQPHQSLKNMSSKYGDVMSLSIGRQRVVVINGIEQAREALLRNGEDLSGRPQDTYPASLLTRNYQDIGFADNGPAMKLMRKIAHASLKMYGSGLEELENSILIEIKDLFARYDEKAGMSIDPHQDIAMAVINIICAIIFGARYKTADEEFLKVVEMSRLTVQGMDNASAISFIPWLRFFPNEGLSKLKRAIAIRDELLSRKLKEHKETFEPNNLRDFTDALLNEFSNEKKADSKVGLLLTDVNLEMILADLFIAGAETTTTTLYWCFAYLVRWPEVQTKIAEEREKVIGNRQPRLSDRKSLPYFEATILETLRLSSLVPLGVPHKTTRDTKIGDQMVPKGTQVWLNQWAYHHDEREWKEPESFKPERWLEEDGSLVPGKNQSYMPFGAGRRVCLGEALAKAELFLFLSNMLYKYELKKAPEGLPSLEGILSITFSPKPYKIVLKQRI